MDYKKAGVDITAGKDAVTRIKSAVESTYNENVLSGLGKFAGFFRIDTNRWKNPVLVSSTDGVGTKIIVAVMANKFDTIGIDLVNHCVNDIFVHNAAPLIFLDYIGTGKLLPEKIEKIIRGMVIACNYHEMALIGGEMAEMPDVYRKDDIDIVGTIVGCCETGKVVNGETIRKDDLVVGFASSGLHTNGYTLARHILFNKMKLDIDDYLGEFGSTVGEALLTPHKSYYPLLKDVINGKDAEEELPVTGMAHITGGGIAGNLSRVIPTGLCAEIDCSRWDEPPIFTYLERNGKVDRLEMFSAFNMGIGFVAVAPESSVDKLTTQCSGTVIGRIKNADSGNDKVKLINI